MTPADLRQTLATLAPLGLTARRLAALWGYRSETSVRQMLAGEQRVPPALAAWLRAFEDWSASHPAPHPRQQRPQDGGEGFG